MKNSIIKRLLALVLLMCLLAISSCESRKEPVETLLPSASVVYDGYEFFAEKFTYREHSNPEREDTPLEEKTGYRVAQKHLTSREAKCVCMDPACLHTIDSECPVVSRKEIADVSVSNNYVFFLCNPSLHGGGEKTALKCYNPSLTEKQETAEVRQKKNVVKSAVFVLKTGENGQKHGKNRSFCNVKDRLPPV